VLAALALKELKKFETKAQAKKNLVAAIETVSKKLGNTPAVCKKCYIHPHVFDSYLDGTLIETLKKRAKKELAASQNLKGGEAAVLRLLRHRLTLEEKLSRSLKKETAVRSSRRKVTSRSL
jgi:DNA topoisomerase-1